jgi:uncharacterized membrane protein YhaH (DUF805 family)
MKWYLLTLKSFVVFTGRSRRTEFWMFLLFNLLITVGTRIIDQVTGCNFPMRGVWGGGYISLAYDLFILLPGLSLTVRRFHDIGKSGWVLFRFLLAFLIFGILGVVYNQVLNYKGQTGENPFADLSFLVLTSILATIIVSVVFWFVVLLLREGTHGTNPYGPDPKQPV